jgi:hypothetical protein
LDKHDALQREVGTRIDAWLAAVDDVDPSDWKPIADTAELPAQARADSRYWCDQVFCRGANPYDAPDTTRAIRCGAGCAPDLVRHDYTADGLLLHVVESRNFLLVSIDRRSLDVLALPEGERAAAVARAAQTIFRAPLSFCLCKPPADGALFCTDPHADPMLVASWAERADGGVRGGELWFACYKRVSQLVGFANPAQWFRDERCSARRAPQRAAPQRRSKP